MLLDEAWAFSPYVLWRRGALRFGSLAPLVPTRTWSLIEEGRSLQDERDELKAMLLPHLHAAVPKLPDIRLPLIRLQRELHNDRVPTPSAMEAVRRLLPADLCKALGRWDENLKREAELAARAGLALQAELRDADARLAELAANEDIALGLQLSAQSLRGAIHRLAACSAPDDDKTSRRAKRTLASLLYRTALKPSPFSTFTDIGAHGWSPPPGRDRPIRERGVRLSRMLLDWMEYELCQLDECRDRLPLTVNNTVRQGDSRLEFLSRPPNGSPQMFGAERFVSVPMTAPLRAVLEIASRPTTVHEIMAEASQLGVPADQLRTYLERLIEIGLLERSLGLPDQEPNYARAMSRALAGVPGERAAACATTLSRMGRIEAALAEASSASRAGLMTELSQQVARFAELVERPAPDDTGAPHFYEDGFSTGRSGSWDGEALERERVTLGLITQVFRLFDPAIVERLGLYRLFVETNGGDADVDLLDFYRGFARLETSAMTDLMCGVGDDRTKEIDRLAGLFLDHLATYDISAASIDLDQAWLRRFVAEFPDFLAPLSSVSIRLQRFRTDDSQPGWVINGVGPGHGARFSRFCRSNDGADGGWSLRAAVAEHIRRQWPRQADLAVTLGVNTNLHPSLCPMEVEYPRSRASPDARKALRLSDLAVRADHRRRRLILLDKTDRQPIDLVPLTFLFPAGGPSLYRFLFAFGPFLNPPRRIWDDVLLRMSTARGPVRLPRIQAGRFALERRSWKISADLVKPPPSLPPRSVEGMAALDRIRVKLGLPREGFFRLLPDAVRKAQAAWADEPRYWSVEARRGRRDKPHYVDFRNPALTEILLKRLAEGGTLIFQECLPSTADYDDEGSPDSAEEYVVELNHGRAP